MTYPWAAGEVLTAADLNAYAGLVLVKTQTIGTAVASVTVSDAFSATFDNYRVTIDGYVSSVNTSLQIALGTSATGSAYYGSQYYDLYTGSTGAARSSNATRLNISQIATFAENSQTVEIHQPFLVARTQFIADGYGQGYSTWARGTHASTVSFSAFTISPGTGTLTGGKIRVYGYNNG